jgi:hypothetical protein
VGQDKKRKPDFGRVAGKKNKNRTSGKWQERTV